jgi:Arc/MetJ-type ribon-helix-helix transcriptional regulator
MPQSKFLEVNLSEESLEFVRGKVASGEYPSASDFLDHSIQSMIEDEQELRRFEREEVVAAYEESLADSSSAIPIDRVRRNLREAFEQRYKAG